jgi:hypothetical protein
MTERDKPGQGLPADSADAGAGRVSFERLRERTDELELIISGLSLLALLSLPGWLWERFETLYARMPLEVLAAVIVLLPMLSAICYVMAALFLLHLGVRAHWVGLIGLKAVLPCTVRWERLEGVGPITLERLRRRLPSIEQAIERADTVASTLFSLITFSAMALATLAGWMVLLFVVGGLFGTQLGGTNHFINSAVGLLFMAFLFAPLARWLLDGVLARRFQRLRELALFRWLVSGVGFVESLLLPPRPLGLPRLALQSHLAPRLFLPVFVLVIFAVVWSSNQAFQSGRGFDVFGNQRFADSAATAAGQRSHYYESQRTASGRVRPVPMIPAPLIESAYLPVFLPYVALIDDPVLSQRCPEQAPPAPQQSAAEAPQDAEQGFFSAQDSSAAADARDAQQTERTRRATTCLAKLWELRLDGVVQALDGFLISERADLGLRGMSGYLALGGLSAGAHTLEVLWRPRPEQDRIVEDYVPKRMRHVIPFVWSPEAAAQPGP